MRIAQSDRIYLRRFEEGDAQFLYDLNADPEVIRFTGDPPFGSVEEALGFIKGYDHYLQYGHGRWMVIRRDDEECLGWCGIKYSPYLNEHDLGFRFAKQYWGQGYATESGRLAVRHSFGQLQIDTLVGRAMIDNQASVNVLIKLGFEYQKQIAIDHQAASQYVLRKT